MRQLIVTVRGLSIDVALTTRNVAVLFIFITFFRHYFVVSKIALAGLYRFLAVTEEGLSPALHAKHLQSAGLVGVDSIDGGSTMDASFQLDPMALRSVWSHFVLY